MKLQIWRNLVSVFSIDMAYPFLNFRVGLRQQGFQIKGMKSIGRNLFLAICFG